MLVPRSDTKTKDGGVAGFPRDFTVQIATDPEKYTTVAALTNCPAPDAKGLSVDLYTVIGYPKVRRVKPKEENRTTDGRGLTQIIRELCIFSVSPARLAWSFVQTSGISVSIRVHPWFQFSF